MGFKSIKKSFCKHRNFERITKNEYINHLSKDRWIYKKCKSCGLYYKEGNKFKKLVWFDFLITVFILFPAGYFVIFMTYGNNLWLLDLIKGFYIAFMSSFLFFFFSNKLL